MTTIRYDLIYAALNRAFTSIDYNIHKDFHKNYELRKQIVLANDSLTEEEKTEAIRINNKDYDRDKIIYNSGTRRISNFSNWSSGNSEIDDLIRNCQSGTLRPNVIIEWIPYDNLKNIKYLTRGGFSKIYTAGWIGGCYEEWNSKTQQLERVKRPGIQNIVLKELENFENANQRWLEEANSHLIVCNKYSAVVRCYAPEVINGKEYTFKSDIYSIAMLIPKIIFEIPSKYKSLMEQCWDANPLERPDIGTLLKKIREIKSYYHNKPDELPPITEVLNKETSNNTSSKLFTSKIHKFENLPEPKNATEGEQEAFHSKLYNFSIPDNINDFAESSNNQNTKNNTSKIINIVKDGSKKLSKVFKKLQINSKNNIQNYNNRKKIQQQSNVDINEEDEVYNNPNLHSDEQNELEIPDDGF
ncbi:kinase-like domain-containing protein [Rhizophagus clarus]|uniref:Kinase-like domain-containing protein n=1 Tax=Rhizophagus clarus TaxID=94130 RepID=A0A8H3QHD5_9GLOM|nr:kinase-like domain-containing protein [Rhizophagus clarus]